MEDIATYRVEYVKFWDDWEVDRYGNANLVRMTKVIKGEFEKIKDVKVKDESLTCNTSLEIFNMEVSRLSGIDNDLFTYKVEVANIPCNSVMRIIEDETMIDGTMDQYTMKALWIRGDDEVKLTDEESSDDEDEIAEVFRIDTNIFDYETPICSAFNEFNYLLKVDPDLLTKDITGFKTYDDYKNDWIYEWNKDVPWVDEKPWTDTGVWTEPKPVKHTCEPFNYKTGCSEWPTCSWKEDGLRGDNALDDCELKEEALRNKAIMDGVINNDESCCELKRKWNIYTNYDDAYEINHEDNGNKELCEIYEPPHFKNITVSSANNVVFNYLDTPYHSDPYIGPREGNNDNIGGEFTNLKSMKCWSP
ncbi:hypothetical protein Tco_1253394 [Tanacetum coccineum]